jgi:hypothetical protein
VAEGISQLMINGPESDDLPHLSFVTCLSSPEKLRTNVLASPCLRPGTAHQVITVDGCPNAADGLNAGFQYAKHELLVCAHQDVYLPEGWGRGLAQQLQEAERRFGPIGVAGDYGVGPVLLAEGGPAGFCAAKAAKGGSRCEKFIPHPSSFIPARTPSASAGSSIASGSCPTGPSCQHAS